LPVAEATMSIVPNQAPGQCHAEQENDDASDRAAGWRRRRFHDLKRRRQKCQFFAAPSLRASQRDHVWRGLGGRNRFS